MQHSLQPTYTHQPHQAHQTGYIPNIPTPSLTAGYSMPPVAPVPSTQLVNPYSCQQPSPDSQGFANLNLASPSAQHKQGQSELAILEARLEVDTDNISEEQYRYDRQVENISGKLDSVTLSDVLDSLNVPPEEPRRGKRSQQTAALESGSNVVPREMARMGGVGGGGPDNTATYAGYLNNCRQINDL